MAYNTGNPIGSTSPKDLSDNARNLDLLLLGDDPSYPDRKGAPRKSWKGMEAEYVADRLRRATEFHTAQTEREAQFKAFLDASGYEAPAPYQPGLTLERATQVVTYLGKEYRAKSQYIPLETTAWAIDESKLKLIGDDSLRQDMANAIAPDKGAGMIGFQLPALGARYENVYDLLTEEISLARFEGFDPTGIKDSSKAWKNAFAYIATKSRKNSAMSNAMNGFKLIVPSGDILIEETSALSMLFTDRVIGLTIESEGHSRIFYKPKSPGPLFVNDDKVLFLRVKGLFFVGQDKDSDFFSSTSHGGAQDYVFSDCLFHGDWRYGMNRKGSNTDSEFKWSGCSFSGKWTVWDYIGDDGTSDQFVNNWYTQCKYWSTSPWLEYHKGGHVRLVTCDISGYSPNQLPAGEGPSGNRTNYLFKLMGRTHAYGVCSFSVTGGRAEQKSRWAGLLYCEWPQGAVTLDAFDSSSQAFTDFGADIESFYFSPGNNSGPSIQFTQAELIGYNIFESLQTTAGRARIAYDNSSFLTQSYQEDAFIFRDVGGQIGARPTVRLRNTRGRPSLASVGTYADADLNWQYSVIGHTSNKAISLKSPTGALPAVTQGAVSVALPKGALITKITIFVPRGASGSGATAAYTVETSEPAPTVLATLNLAPISAGGKTTVEPLFACDTREKTLLRLVPSATMNTAQGSGSFCVIEYMG